MNATNSYPNNFFRSVLEGNDAALPLRIEEILRTLNPSKALASTDDLDLGDYVLLGHATAEVCESPRPSVSLYWGGLDEDRLFPSYTQVLWRVEWQAQSLQVLQATWQTSCGGQSRYWVIGDSSSDAEEFILDVHRKTNDPGDSILVFKEGGWQRSREMFDLVQSTSMSELVLPTARRKEMIDDFQRFLKSQSHYEALGVAWRRGAILVGPPGNGKTHFLRALVHELEVPCLYVQSIAHPYYEAEQLLQRIFQRARELRPCILIFEDLDSLINQENRSFFLNQLDGFERNHGLMVIATTNHPENIDSAILDRPSRFDRKYNFPLPELEQRVRFLEIWKDKLQGSGAVGGSWDNSSIMVVAQQTEGFSFAYMKELMVSSLLQWIDQEQAVELGGLLIKQQVEGRLDFPQILAQQATLLQQQRRCSGA